MANFESFSEDALPRHVPTPTIDVRAAQQLHNTLARPSVPELSILNYAGPVQPPVAKAAKPISYSEWKKENIVPKPGAIANAQTELQFAAAPLRKTVTFDTPPTLDEMPQTYLPFTTQKPVEQTKANSNPNLCSQLELSAYDPPRSSPAAQTTLNGPCYSSPPVYSAPAYPKVPTPNIRIGRHEPHVETNTNNLNEAIVQCLNSFRPPQQVVSQSNMNENCQPAMPIYGRPESLNVSNGNVLSGEEKTNEAVLQLLNKLISQNPKPIQPPKTTHIDIPPLLVEIIRALSSSNLNNLPLEANPAQNTSLANQPDTNHNITNGSPPNQKPKNDCTASEPTTKELLLLIQKQQDQITVLQQQMNHLLKLQDKDITLANHQPSHAEKQLQQTQSHQISEQTQPYQIGEEEIGLGEEASNMDVHKTPQVRPFHRLHHNSPADWKFYGNTLEQVAQILQNAPSPTTRMQHPQVEKVFQVSHVQGMHFSDVNVSATQRVTFGQTTPTETRGHQAVSDRSMAMNTLALKYLPECQRNDSPGEHVAKCIPRVNALNGHSNSPPLVSAVPTTRPSSDTDMSSMTLDYLKKYGLLQNKRLFSDN